MTSTTTPQIQKWQSDFGQKYTDRNPQSLEELESLYRDRYGLSRSDMNQKFLGEIDHSMRILEVGSNIGLQLACLRSMGFESVCGIEIQRYAVERSKQLFENLDVIQGSAFDIPFKDGYFDLVYTSGVLIHIRPDDLPAVLQEIHRVSRRWIWGFEYFNDEPTEIDYRGNSDLLWKRDFARFYLDTLPGLKLIQEQRFKYADSDSVDSMYLLEKPDPTAA